MGHAAAARRGAGGRRRLSERVAEGSGPRVRQPPGAVAGSGGTSCEVETWHTSYSPSHPQVLPPRSSTANEPWYGSPSSASRLHPRVEPPSRTVAPNIDTPARALSTNHEAVI